LPPNQSSVSPVRGRDRLKPVDTVTQGQVIGEVGARHNGKGEMGLAEEHGNQFKPALKTKSVAALRKATVRSTCQRLRPGFRSPAVLVQ
jgi:hypothetical protein